MTLPTVMDLGRTAAMIFDTDGGITDTARVHAAAWKRGFDAFLRGRAERSGERFRPFAGAGRFGVVVGVDRHGNGGSPRAAGADLVVTDLARPRLHGRRREPLAPRL
ncbi:hypothetical protein [Streptosporangium minutum]|uniref:Hydrolase n=1 Tax=Streptosporangium minutum TaxID=569862 RepID=A0A243RXW0_9ACTN|nr:hypothetical protein CA984_00665 [Streptosporangium minutum]